MVICLIDNGNMKFPVIASLLIAIFCIVDYVRHYNETNHHKKIIYKYFHLVEALEWIVIALINAINSLLFIPILIIGIAINIKLNKTINSSNFRE